MTPPPIASIHLADLPQMPECLSRILAERTRQRTRQSLRDALATDEEVAVEFLRLAAPHLPGRRLTAAREAIALLDGSVGRRLALLAACKKWLDAVLAGRPELPPLLRHVVATACAAEPLGRKSGVVEPLEAYALGLLHHVGDAVLLAKGLNADDVDPAEVAAALLRASGLPAQLVRASHEYGGHAELSDALAAETLLVATADRAATALGYAAPAALVPPVLRPDVERAAEELLLQRPRVCASIEDAIAAVFRDRDRGVVAQAAPLQAFASLFHVDDEGVSSRDLGPLPVLLARIGGGRDPEAVEVATTAGLVEELDASRAYFLRLDALGRAFTGGILCSRGSVPLALPELHLRVEDVPRPMRVALAKGRPILHVGHAGHAGSSGKSAQGGLDGLEFLNVNPKATTFFVPVVVDHQQLGIIGAEVTPDCQVSPDVLASVAAHCALARKAADLRKLSDEAKIDELTGLFNRRGISDVLDRCLVGADAKGENLAIALIDCDHLKLVNDNFGHLMGDEFVRRSSEVVRASLRTRDELGRYGGDEFLAVLPDASLTQTRRAMERARLAVERAGLESADGLLLSISIGAVVRGASGVSREGLLKLADTALYKAKQLGRNSINVLDAEQPPDLSL